MKRPVTVEFKSLHNVDEYQPWEDLEEYLTNALVPHGLNFSSFEIEFTPKALADREMIAEGLVAVNRLGARDFQQLPRGTGQAKIADGMGRLSLPLRQYDDVSRILAKLKSKWWKQLQKVHGPAVVVVRAANLFGCRADERLMVLHRLVAGLVELLPKRKMNSAMLVYDETPGLLGRSGALVRGTFRIAVGPSQDGCCSRTAVFVPNSDPRVARDADECDRLVGPNMFW